MRKKCLSTIAKQTSCALTIHEAPRQDFLEASIFSSGDSLLTIFYMGKIVIDSKSAPNIPNKTFVFMATEFHELKVYEGC